MIRDVRLEDAAKISDIYNYYIKNTIITFEEIKVDSHEIQNRIKTVLEKFFWIVYEEDGEIKAYAYITGFNQVVIDPDDPLKDGFLL